LLPVCKAGAIDSATGDDSLHARPPQAEAQTCKSFLVLFFKKEQERKRFFLKKEAKTFWT